MLSYLIAHRGASGHEPENTVRSFKRAFGDGANAIEVDLRMSRHGELVVIHDRTVDRTTGGSGPVHEMDLSALRTLDAGKGEAIPTFEEVLRLVGGGKTIFAHMKVPGAEERFVSMLREYEALDKVVPFGSRSIMEAIRQLEPSMLCSEPGRVRMSIAGISEKEARDMHDRGLILVSENVNHEEEMPRLIALGLDGIVTDYPDRLFRVVREMPDRMLS